MRSHKLFYSPFALADFGLAFGFGLAGLLLPQPAKAETVRLGAELGQQVLAAGKTQTQYRHIIWTGILHTASLDGWQHGEPPTFWREVLLQIALTLDVTYVSLVSGIYHRIQARTTGTSARLKHIVEVLFQDLQLEDAGPKELLQILNFRFLVFQKYYQ